MTCLLYTSKKFMTNKKVKSELVTRVSASQIMEVGAEFSPEQYLPQPEWSEEEQNIFVENITKSILTASVCIEAVSYTHLDVYKRQKHMSCSFRDKIYSRVEVNVFLWYNLVCEVQKYLAY